MHQHAYDQIFDQHGKFHHTNLYEAKLIKFSLCHEVEISKNSSNRFEKMKWCRNFFSFEWNDVGTIFHSNEKYWDDNKFLQNNVEMIISLISFEWNEKNYQFNHIFSEEFSAHFAAYMWKTLKKIHDVFDQKRFNFF